MRIFSRANPWPARVGLLLLGMVAGLMAPPAWSQAVKVEGTWPGMAAREALKLLGTPTSLQWGERGGVTLLYRDRCEVNVARGGLVDSVEGPKANVCGMLLEPHEIQQWLGPPDIQDTVGTVWREPGLCVLQRGRPQYVVILSRVLRKMGADWTPPPWEPAVARWEVDGISLGLAREEVESTEGRPVRRPGQKKPTWHKYRSGVRVRYRGGYVAEVRGRTLGRNEGDAHPNVAEAGCIVPPKSILEQEPPPEYTGVEDPTGPGPIPNVRKIEERARFFQLVDLRRLLDTCERVQQGTLQVYARPREGLFIETERNLVKEFHLSRATHEIFDLLERSGSRVR